MVEHDVATLPNSTRVFERGWLLSDNILSSDDEAHGGCALVDSGYLVHVPQAVALVQHTPRDRPLCRLLSTHLHSDRCDGNTAPQALYGSHTRVLAVQIDDVRRWDTDAPSYGPTDQECAHLALSDGDADAGLSDGMTTQLGGFGWQAISAPGHDPHAIILLSPDTHVLIPANALRERGFGVISPELEGKSDFAEQQTILERIIQLDALVVTPGHDRPFTSINTATDTSLGRLAYLRADPEHNVLRIICVLVKLKLLGQQVLSHEVLSAWFTQTTLIPRLYVRFFAAQSMEMLLDAAIMTLVKTGVTIVEHGRILNRD